VAENMKDSVEHLSSPPINRTATSASVPLIARLSHELPKPRDWQAFQRNCTLLFQAELNDPNAQEYGRGGQKQGGIDILGKRNGNPDHYVGIQCRLITKPLKEPGILKECSAALELEAGLKEIIFATTAPHDTHATDAAIAVERTLRREGHNVTVVVYGWEALQNKIAVHDVAYAVFCPSSVATSAPQTLVNAPQLRALGAEVAAQVIEQLRQTGVALSACETSTAASKDEDPALHAKIDTFRDLVREENEPVLAEKGLLALLEKELLDGKPWARFRIETNLGAIALSLGREAEGAARFEAAFAVRPDDPNAVANLALARIIQGRPDEAMDLALQALDATPRAAHAIECLFSAAARSTWHGEPETLIPPDLVGNIHADLGLAEFLRRRNIPGWAERSLELSRQHADVQEFKQVRAIAVLNIALESEQFLPGDRSSVTIDELNRAADDMKAAAEHLLDIGFADEHDLFAYLNNAGMLLRLCGRHAECEALLRRGLPRVPDEPQLHRLLALAQAVNGHRGEALATLAAGDDPENRLLAADLIAVDNPSTALAQALAINPTTLNPHLARLRWRLVGELALKTGETDDLRSAVAGLRALDSSDVLADLLEILGERKVELDDNVFYKRLRAVAASLPDDADMMTRYVLAEELQNQGLPEEASRLLEEHVDLSRRSPATRLYLQSLAAARRDETFLRAVAVAGPAVQDDPETLWVVAAHAWNIGDLSGAYRTTEALLAQEPDNPRARLLKIEILLRQDRSAELLAELEKPVENLAWARLQDQFRIASLFGHFGYIKRGASAYRLFLEHRDKSQAWMTLSMLVLEAGQGRTEGPGPWDAQVVAPNIAVDLRYDNGEEAFFVVEPDASLRHLDTESWEPEHPLVQTLLGSGIGARFIVPTGREARSPNSATNTWRGSTTSCSITRFGSPRSRAFVAFP
jgi:cellulose synthase operon protein C